MFKRDLIISIRHLVQDKFDSVLKILGLSIALVPILLTFLYVKYEYSYDKFHPEHENIYRIVKSLNSELNYSFGVIPSPLIVAIDTELNSVNNITKLWKGKYLVEHRNVSFPKINIMFTDTNFVSLFNLDLLSSEKKDFLRDKYSVLISKSAAKKLFGNKNPIGKTLTLLKTYDVMVSGVFNDYPKNSHFEMEIIASTGLIETVKSRLAPEMDAYSWGFSKFFAYCKIDPNVDKSTINNQINSIFNRYAPSRLHNRDTYYLEALDDIHLNSSIQFDIAQNGSPDTIILYISITLILFIMAIINYINLTIAKITKRIKQICIRKISGADISQIYSQLFIETLITSFISLIISVVLILIVFPQFNTFVERNISIEMIDIVTMLGTVIFISIIATIYPVFISKKIDPISFLNGKSMIAKKNSLFRIVVSFQVFISITLLFGSQVISEQFDTLVNKDLGFEHKGIYAIDIQGPISENKIEILRNEFTQNKNIQDFCFSSFRPASETSKAILDWKGKTDDKENWVHLNAIDFNFISFFDIKILKGRNFNKSFISDKHESILINETAAKLIGTEKILEKRINFEGERQVIGVIKDIHSGNRKFPVAPAYFFVDGGILKKGRISLKLNPSNLTQTMKFIKDKIKNIDPDYKISFIELEEDIINNYKDEQKISIIAKITTFCGIFISLLGVLGMVSNMTERRKKEIGVRKISGASSVQIMQIFFKETFFMNIISTVISYPVSIFLLNKWLENYAYKIELNFLYFILTSAILYIIILLTISAHMYKASIQNPIDVIREQ